MSYSEMHKHLNCRCKKEEYFRYWHRNMALKERVNAKWMQREGGAVWICNGVKSA